MAKDKHSSPDYEPDEQENKKGIKSFMSKFLSSFVEEVEVDDDDEYDDDEPEEYDDDESEEYEEYDDDEPEEYEEYDDDEPEEYEEYSDDEPEEYEEYDDDELEESPEDDFQVTEPEESVLPTEEILQQDSVEIPEDTEEFAEPDEVPPVEISEQIVSPVPQKETPASDELLFDAPEDMPDFRDDAVPEYDSDAITLESDSQADTAPENDLSDELDVYFPDDDKEDKNISEDDEDEDEDDDEEDENAPKKKSLLSIALPFAFILALGLGFAYCFQLGLFDEKPTYLMPDFVGKSYYDIGEDFNNFDIQVAYQDYSSYDKDIVYAQDIPAGTEVKLGQTVNISLSLGYAQTKVPDVKNYQFEYAQKILEQSGFEVEIAYEASLNGTAQNNVIRTLPDSGQSVNAGSKITMYVSEGLGADSAQVQTFTGMLLEEATALCEMYGLRVDAVPVPSLDPENVVVEQSIEAGTKVPFHTVITLAYSSGEQPQGLVNYQINFPPYATGRFILDFININGDVVASSDIIVAGFSAGSTIPVQGMGSQEIKVVLNNMTTNLQAELGTYSFDFTTGTYAIIEEDMQKAFEDVKGIGNG